MAQRTVPIYLFTMSMLFSPLGSQALFLIVDFVYVLSVVNIGATALVTEAATAIFGEAGVSAATGVMTVCMDLS